MVTCDCQLSPEAVEAGGSDVQHHPQLLSEFEASLGHAKPCLWEGKKLPEKSWARQISSDILSAEPTASEQN